MVKTCCLLMFLLLPVPGAWAQGSDIFPDVRRQALREEVVFERPEPPPPPDLPAQELPSFDLSAYRTPLIVGISGIVLAGLSFLLYRIFRDLKVKRRADPHPAGGELDASELIEEELVESGVSATLLERAETGGQYAIAVRLRYLGLLHALTQAGLIRYRRDFSNRDYLRQLEGKDLRHEFGAATRLYEQYWYGSYRIDRLSYRVVRQAITELEARVVRSLPQPAGDD